MLLRRLLTISKVVLWKGKIPSCCLVAEGIFPQIENITPFRTISLLNVEGNIFFSVLAKRLTTFMSTHMYKREEIRAYKCISKLIREAKIRNGDLNLVWLDLANAYGSIPHQLTSVALQHQHVPHQAYKLVKRYFGDHTRHTS